jgi:hypothetical protein
MKFKNIENIKLEYPNFIVEEFQGFIIIANDKVDFQKKAINIERGNTSGFFQIGNNEITMIKKSTFIENITKNIISTLDNTLNVKATEQITSNIAFHIEHQFKKRLEEQSFVFEVKAELLDFCDSRLSMNVYEDLDGWNSFEIMIDNEIFLTEIYEITFLTYYPEK